MRSEVESRIIKHGLEKKVRLYGALGHREALSVIAQSSVFAQHSVTSVSGDQEGLPVAILEAITLGLPVVSTIHSGIPEAIEDGVNGFLVREHDFESMAERMIELLRGDRALTMQTSSGKCFDLESRVEKIARILCNLNPRKV